MMCEVILQVFFLQVPSDVLS